MSSKVSVVLPVYNCEKHLDNCIKSILNQSYTNIEIIIINDGSTDRSELIINKFKETDSRIIYYSQINKGPSEARNIGISNSTGRYVVFVDSDDTIAPRYIESLVENIICSKSDLVCCGYKEISNIGLSNFSDFNYLSENSSLKSFVEMVCEGTGGVLWSKIFKNEIIEKNNLKMDKQLYMCEDLVFVLQYATFCDSFYYINQYLYNYNRLNQMSITSNFPRKYIKNFLLVNRYIELLLNKMNFEKNKIEGIILKRNRDFILNFIEHQCKNIRKIGFGNTIKNINYILSFELINNNSVIQKDIYKPHIYLIKRKKVILIISYSLYLNFLRKIKNKIMVRWRKSHA